MNENSAALLLRVYGVAGDRAGEVPLHEAIVQAARREGLNGASVFTAKMGFGGGGFYSDLLNEAFSEFQPVVVDIVESAERIARFAPMVQSLVRGRRLITVEATEIVCYRAQSTPDLERPAP